ncbi:MAG: ATP-binding protein [Chloroflexi bacterium]|nr:ATP-binding protein [Chloroflexota bacterium]
MTTPFIGRSRELGELARLYRSQKAQFLILYGRRRIGKTRLITHWIETTKPRALFWVAEPTSSADQLRSFSQTIFRFETQSQPPADMTYGDWRTAFETLARLAEKERLAVIIDEFTYLLEAEPAVSAYLQHAWDHILSKSNLFLIISGSHLGMMNRQVLSYQAPLYGRSTANLLLQPLPFGVTQSFYPRYRADERVAVYAMLGGVPAYWERFDPEVSISENIRKEFLNYSASLHDEPRLLLADFLRDQHNYVSIFRAIANGAGTPKEIARFSGLDEKHIPQYLNVLTDTGFIARRVPVTQPPSSRLGRHFITDPFLRFYYRFLARRQSQLALGVDDQALEEIKRHLLDFIGTYTWEELCQEWLLRATGHARLPFLPDQVGSAWTRSHRSGVNAQVDVVGINSMEKTLILGECKWSPKPMGRDVLETLIQKTTEFVPTEGRWRVHYLGFARGGWSREAQAFAKAFGQTRTQGENWNAAGLSLLDLSQVDQDLKDWSERTGNDIEITF